MPKRRPYKLPPVGTVFQRTFRGKLHTMRVVNDRGKTAFQVSGRVFGSPSAAAKHITKSEVNGWRFWYIPQS